MKKRILETVVVLCVLTLGCNPNWQHTGGDDEPYNVVMAPIADVEAAAPITRFGVSLAAAEVLPEPSELMVYRGRLGKTSLAQIEDGVPSAALQARAVPLGGFASGTQRWLLPLEPMEPGADYTLVSGEPLWSFKVTIMLEDSLPQLRLVWPPEGVSSGKLHGVWCAAMNTASWPLAPLGDDEVVKVEGAPTPIHYQLRRGVGAARLGHCLRLETQPWPDALPVWMPPVARTNNDEEFARIDPTPLRLGVEAAEPVMVSCAADEVPFGPGCARVTDDRAWVHAPEARLWGIATEFGVDNVYVAEANVPFLVAPLPANTQVSLEVTTVTLNGSATSVVETITTAPAQPHVVLSEVLANSLGPEPHQEWVELYNDGSAAAHLEEYRLQDIGGDVWLPPAVLPPGAFAVIVNETFDDAADYDVVIPADALILRVAALGKNGLNNSGEPLKLLHQDEIVSRFPAAPKPQAGLSVARFNMKAGADDPTAFAVAQPTPAQANLLR